MDRALEYLTEIAQCGSLAKAAKRLFITSSALSKFVIQRENELCVQLFHRDGNHFSLTYAGERYIELLGEVAVVQRKLDEEMSRAADLYMGKLRIGIQRTMASTMVKHFLPKIRERYRDTPVSLIQNTAPVMKEMLAENRLDIVLCTTEEEDPRFHEVRVYESPIVLAGPKDPALLARAKKREGFPYPWLSDDIICEIGFLDHEGEQIRRYVPHLYGQISPKKRNSVIVGAADTALLCVEEGLGLAPMSDLLVRELHFEERVRLFSFGPWQRNTWLTVLSDPRSMQAEATAYFANVVRSYFSEV